MWSFAALFTRWTSTKGQRFRRLKFKSKRGQCELGAEHRRAVSGGQPSACLTLVCVCHVFDMCFIELRSCEKKNVALESERKLLCCSSPFLRLQVKGMSALPGVIGVLCKGCDRSHLPCLGGSSSSYTLSAMTEVFLDTFCIYPLSVCIDCAFMHLDIHISCSDSTE